jgi:Cu-Zn family superoxide dismutase
LYGFRQRTVILVLVVGGVAALISGGGGSALAQVATPTPTATAEIRDASNRVLGTATLREGHGEVLINMAFPTPPVLSGTHAIHITDTGRCDAPDFSTSGNIFNPFNKQHGRQNSAGYEVGDLPNVNLATGLTSYNTTASGATLGQGQGSLLSPARAMVIFSGEDDQNTAPDGNAGTRIGCGVITASTAAAVGAAPAAAAPAVAAPAVAAPAVAAQPVAPGVGVVPTATPLPTPNTNAAAPRIASPVPAQVQQPAAPAQVQQPAPAQVQQPGAVAKPGQPAVAASSPVVVPKPVVVNNSAAASPVPAVAQQPVAQQPVAQQPVAQQPVAVAAAPPTPIVVQPTPLPVAAAPTTPQTSGTGNTTNALIIAVLGVGLVGVGYLLRRKRQLQ